jgi:hypothetical protein
MPRLSPRDNRRRPARLGGGDGSTPLGRFAIGILTLIAELEIEHIRKNWTSAVTQAVGRGIHTSRYTPTGYRRDKDRRLHPDDPAATIVAECFWRRATAGAARVGSVNSVGDPLGRADSSSSGGGEARASIDPVWGAERRSSVRRRLPIR